jgi:hypothetical protein
MRGPGAKEDAVNYAKSCIKFGRGEVRVMNADGLVENLIQI